jgi:hypothetical protein
MFYHPAPYPRTTHTRGVIGMIATSFLTRFKFLWHLWKFKGNGSDTTVRHVGRGGGVRPPTGTMRCSSHMIGSKRTESLHDRLQTYRKFTWSSPNVQPVYMIVSKRTASLHDPLQTYRKFTWSSPNVQPVCMIVSKRTASLHDRLQTYREFTWWAPNLERVYMIGPKGTVVHFQFGIWIEWS